MAGVAVSAVGTTHQTYTDKDGRYELLGCPKSNEGYGVGVRPPEGQAYLSLDMGPFLPDTPGLGPLQADFELISGLVARGRVTHAKTGRPIEEVVG